MFSDEREAAEYLSHYFRMLGRKQQMKDENPEFKIYTCNDCEAKFYWNKSDEMDIKVECCADGNCCLKIVCPYGVCWRKFKECGHSQYCSNELQNDSFIIEYCKECMDEIKLEKTKRNREMLRTSKLTLDKIDGIPLEIQGEIMSHITLVKMFTKDSFMKYKMYDIKVELEDDEYKECERILKVEWYGLSVEEHNKRYGW